MGLAAPRKRVKLSHDPNNTTWTKDTTRFGHKIMLSQGWTPGSYLGPSNASHAEFHTAANKSHIKVVLKDDNLGLGAKRSAGLADGECTGLDVFQRLLGRLNGEDEEELEREQKRREDLRRAVYTERRWGSTRFVRGGYLVGDRIQELVEVEEERVRRLRAGKGEAEVDGEGEVEEELEEGEEVVVEKPVKEKVKAKKSKKEKKDKKDKKDKKEKKEKKEQQKEQQAEDETPDPHSTEKDRKKKKKSKDKTPSAKIEDSELKSHKKKRKAKSEPELVDSEEVVEELAEKSVSPPSPPSRFDSPSISSMPPIQMTSRHAVRSRNIAQKRLAFLDTASLNQIFMIKQQST